MRLSHLPFLIMFLICWSCNIFKSGSKKQSISKSEEHVQNGLPLNDSITGLANTKTDSYRGIWFELNQKYHYGDKYSGGLGTYTAKHIPLAIYAPEVDKTFFVYGGTTNDTARYLLCMIGVYDHRSGKVSKPTIVCDKHGVNDPHDNPSLMIDDDGYIWVFVSGRGRSRPGFKYRSQEPYSSEQFDRITEEEMTYPQPWNTKLGYLHLFTKYTGVRQLYFEHSSDGVHWSDDQLLAAIPQESGEKSGHYQVSAADDFGKVGTFFNRHPQGNVDRRTDLYYLQTEDLGSSWTDAEGNDINIPLTDRNSSARVMDFYSSQKNVYLKDMGFTTQGYPVGLFIRSNGHEPGPENAPYQWFIAQWNGTEWRSNDVTVSDHNYDMGSLFIGEDTWRIVGPTTPATRSPQKWGVGGELEVWESMDMGITWNRVKVLTQDSQYNHSYVRRPLNYKAPFCFFWADGDPHHFSPSRLYFGDFEGNVWKLPDDMEEEWVEPEKMRN